MVVGYFLATLPPLILDPILKSHVHYKQIRTYPHGWLVAPLSIFVLAGTVEVSARSSKRRYIFSMLPFLAASFLSIPIFRPEVPHGNLIFVCSTWYLLGAMTVWIHDTEAKDPTLQNFRPALSAQIEFIKEQTAIWKAIAVGLVTAYLAMAVALTLGLHAAAKDIVTDPQDIFILSQYMNFCVMAMSLFMFLGPVYESVRKVIAANELLLRVQEATPETAAKKSISGISG